MPHPPLSPKRCCSDVLAPVKWGREEAAMQPRLQAAALLNSAPCIISAGVESTAGPRSHQGDINTQLWECRTKSIPSVHASEGPAPEKWLSSTSYSANEEDQVYPRRWFGSRMTVSLTHSSRAITSVYASGPREVIHHPERQTIVLEYITHCSCSQKLQNYNHI